MFCYVMLCDVMLRYVTLCYVKLCMSEDIFTEMYIYAHGHINFVFIFCLPFWGYGGKWRGYRGRDVEVLPGGSPVTACATLCHLLLLALWA